MWVDCASVNVIWKNRRVCISVFKNADTRQSLNLRKFIPNGLNIPEATRNTRKDSLAELGVGFVRKAINPKQRGDVVEICSDCGIRIDTVRVLRIDGAHIHKEEGNCLDESAGRSFVRNIEIGAKDRLKGIFYIRLYGRDDWGNHAGIRIVIVKRSKVYSCHIPLLVIIIAKSYSVYNCAGLLVIGKNI